ncbi:TetR/AcrR family transcriptional regulator [Agrococcus jejuensis]|uniref:TetR/AcrR family transcriptional regulator n=1 Tax=Agrococcus jejuensis TaxID=399736 RepID=UPI0011AB160C|nr:TetR/AcrR family transcriptional regulator [Agrococcus jejuensis]
MSTAEGGEAQVATTRDGRPRRRAPRQDAIRNEQALVDAVGALLREAPDEATMPAVAARAGLSLATAYRYFPTLDQLHRRFMLSVVERADATTSAYPERGQALFERILAHWIDVVEVYGPAMVLVRSREGFLTRFGHGEGQAVALDRMWGRAIRDLMVDSGVPESRYPLALTLYNALLNSREILDVRAATGMAGDELVSHLSRVYRAALQGLAA